MKSLDFGRYTLSSCVAAAMLAGCGGSQPPMSAPGAMPQTYARATQADRAKSWMLPEAKGEDLVYVTGGCGGTCVVSYPAGKIVGSLNVGYGLNSGVCSDSQGNVYVADDTEVIEYAHGGTTQIGTFDLPGSGGSAAGCSVDPTTGKLAVMFGGVAIFTPGSQTPTVYPGPVDGFSCAYDPSGNLFVGGLRSGGAALAELLKDSSSFTLLTIDAKYIEGAGQVEWYGKYLSYMSAFGGAPYIYRFKIAGTVANLVGTTRLSNPKFLWYPWIYQGKILAPWHERGTAAKSLGVWDYPRGGKAIQKIKGFGQAGLESITVSVGSSR
jgi:hypothetical protein